MDNLTFDELPKAITQLFDKLNSIELLLLNLGEEKLTNNDLWLNLNELCDYLPDKPAKATVYGWVHARLIPYHKGSKKLRFLKSEIDIWLKDGGRKTCSEIKNEAGEYLTIGGAGK